MPKKRKKLLAEIIIRIRDTEDGTVNVSADFDPPIDAERATAAQQAAAVAIDAIHRHAMRVHDEDDDL